MGQKELGKAALGLTFRCLTSAHAQDPVAIGMFSISTHVPGRQGGVRAHQRHNSRACALIIRLSGLIGESSRKR
jgi:hypothetical protein